MVDTKECTNKQQGPNRDVCPVVAFTVRLSDDNHNRLKELSKRYKISASNIIESMLSGIIDDIDAETRFRLRVSRAKKLYMNRSNQHLLCCMDRGFWQKND